jgi:hypothetical protein
MLGSAGGSQRRRLRLHELENGFYCSIVGTCLSPGIARQIVRRAKLEFEPDPQDYRLHSILVSEAARPGIVSRLITRALDESFAGTVHRVGATVGASELAALWHQLCYKGEVAGAYWAFLTHAHVPAELRVRLWPSGWPAVAGRRRTPRPSVTGELQSCRPSSHGPARNLPVGSRERSRSGGG